MMNYGKILNWIAFKNKSPFDISVTEQRQLIERLPTPVDLIERSYAQYICWRFFVFKFYRYALNVCAWMVFPIWVAVYGLRTPPRRCSEKSMVLIDVLPEDPLFKTVPDSLKTESMRSVSWNKGWLRRDDFNLLYCIWRRHPFSSYFLLKCMVKIACYRYAAECYAPQSIIVHNEYSFTSSVLTEWCHRNGILHINFMHGERMFNIRSSFFAYDKCYVWDEHYKRLYEKMRAAPEQFVIEVPDSLRISLEQYVDNVYFADFKYILAIYSEAELQHIVEAMGRLRSQGYSIRYRPHPRYSDIALLRKYVAEDEIEYPSSVSVECSIANSGCVVGSYSTVLLQAYLSGVKVAMDDITYRERYRELNERDYILSNKDDILPLSVLIDG